MNYTVVIERMPTSYSAQVPDLAGCVSVVETKDEVCGLIGKAIDLYTIEALGGEELPIPESHSYELVKS